MYPINCFTCGTPIGHHWIPYFTRLEKGLTEFNILKELRIGNECCRRMFICQIPNVERLIN